MPWRKGHKLNLVPENQAEGRVREIYREIKQVLGVPQVGNIYRALGAYPAFFDLHWKTIRPVAESQQFFALGERLRADAYTRVHSYFAIPDLLSHITNMEFSEGAREELIGVTELYHYSEPLFLLLVAAQFQAFESPVGTNGQARSVAGRPTFSEPPLLIEEDTAPPRVRKVFEEIKRTMDLPVVPQPYRAFARWPDFLCAYWDAVKPMVQSPIYECCFYGLRESAFALTREFPEVVDLTLPQLAEAGIREEEIASVVRICDVFVTSMSGTVLNVELAKIGLEGGTRHAAEPQKRTPQPAGAGKKDQAA